MKKWIVLLATLLLLTVMALPVFAAETEMTVAVSGENAYRGEEIELTVSISGDTPYLTLGYEFDKTYFEYVSFAAEGSVDASINKYDEVTGACLVLLNNEEAYSGKLFVLKLKVKQDAPMETVSVGGRVSVNNGSESVEVHLNTAKITIACRHSYDNWEKTEDKHSATCTLCGKKVDEDHDWDDGILKIPATCTEPGEMGYECLVCGEIRTEQVNPKGHAYTNDCDPDCNNGCGEVRETGHKLANDGKWESDDKTHWVSCTVCGEKVDEVAHIPGSEATEKEPQICLACERVLQVPVGHVHDYDTVWRQDEDGHWHNCKKEGCYSQGSYAAHEYDNACDVTCDICGHVRIGAPHNYGTEWQGNASGHWYVCTICGGQSEVIPHVPGDPATIDLPQTCTECGYWIKFPLSHVHAFGDKWQTDETYHWKSCTECFESAELIPHNWDAGNVITAPTESMQGIMLYRCTDCGFERTAAIPMLGSQSTDPTEGLDSTDSSGDIPTDPADNLGPMETLPSGTQSDDDGGFPWWILVAVAGLLLVTGIVLFVIEFIRSRKHNMHGKYSK